MKSVVARSRSLSATQNDLVEFAQSLDGVRQVNKSDVVANTLSSGEHTCGYCFHRDYHHSVRCVDLPDQQHGYHGYHRETGRDRHYEIYRSKRFCGAVPVVIEGVIIGIFGAAIPAYSAVFPL